VTLAPGTRLGPYEIIASLGAGGMGEVYRARDAKLNRDVAIKVLPERLAADPDALARFEREALAVAALSHPNILAIHDFGEASGQRFAVMELLEGQTLRQALEPGPLTTKRATEYARQIAEGLAAAHAKGIVHRDLKPENVFVTRDGHVKILDFGLARQIVPAGAGRNQTTSPTMVGATEPGMVMGTVGYMAPEQVRGDAVDHRADIFAFGVVLYEMLAGKRPFEGATGAETMTAILREDPPPVTTVRETVPASLERVIDHCLEKLPENRFQSARDLAFALGGASSTSGRAQVADVPAPAAPGRRRLQPALIGVGALILGAAIGALGYRRFVTPAAARPLEVRYLTYSGHDFAPASSPDGRSVAFRSERDGKGRIWLKQLATGTEVALTEGPDDNLPRFSPDGATLLFERRTGARFSLFRVSLLGGEPHRVIDDGLDASWSADGTRIAFMRQYPASPGKVAATGVMIADADGSGAREVVRIPTGVLAPRLSPDGKRIVFTQTAVGSGSFSINSVDVGTGTVEKIVAPAQSARPWVAEWTPDGHLLHTVGQVAAGKLAGTTGRLVALETGGPSRLLFASPDSLGRFAILDADRVVVESQTVRQNVAEWSNGAPHGLTQGRQADRQPVYSPDGKWILFTSDRSGNLDLWMVSAVTGELRQITDDAADDWDPSFGPDGHLYWSSNRSGNFEIWTADGDGSGAHQLTHDGVDAENPTVSPDGKWLVYGSTRPNEAGIWRARSDGSDAKLLARGLYGIPHISPDGQYVLYIGFSSILVSTGVRVVRLADGAPVDFELIAETIRPTSANVGRATWMPDGRGIAFLGQNEKGVNGIFVQDFVIGQNTIATRRPLTGFDPIVDTETFGVAPDGKRVAISGREMVSSLVLLEQPGLTRAR
jgi:Tol biopolymer transport system component